MSSEGLHGMPSTCGPNVNIQHFVHLKKNVYLKHQCYLGRAHPYGRSHVAFNGQPNRRCTPISVFVIDFPKGVEQCEEWILSITKAQNDKEDLVHTHGVKRKNIFFQLPYIGI
jgi:hypothetical protein